MSTAAASTVNIAVPVETPAATPAATTPVTPAATILAAPVTPAVTTLAAPVTPAKAAAPPRGRRLPVFWIVGVVLLVICIGMFALFAVLQPPRSTQDFQLVVNQVVNGFVSVPVADTLLLDKTEYVYGYETIVNKGLAGAANLQVFVGFHEDAPEQSDLRTRLNYSLKNGTSRTPYTYANGILLIDGSMDELMAAMITSSSPFLYDIVQRPLAMQALLQNRQAFFSEGKERVVYLRDDKQFKAGVTYFPILELFGPEDEAGVTSMDVTLRVHVRKRYDFTFW
jgi:hypothetical protein